jgi:hypothetical protein
MVAEKEEVENAPTMVNHCNERRLSRRKTKLVFE